MDVRAVPTACPVCHGPLWDNRVGKKNPKAPDFKCKDKGCDGLYWPPSKKDWFVWGDETTAPATPTKTAAQPQPKAEFVQTDIENNPMPKPKAFVAPVSMPKMCAEYVELAYTLALNLNKAIQECREGDDQPTADLLGALGNEFQAAVATIYIEQNKRAR